MSKSHILRDSPSQHITEYPFRVQCTVITKGFNTESACPRRWDAKQPGTLEPQPVFSRYDVNTVRDTPLFCWQTFVPWFLPNTMTGFLKRIIWRFVGYMLLLNPASASVPISMCGSPVWSLYRIVQKYRSSVGSFGSRAFRRLALLYRIFCIEYAGPNAITGVCLDPSDVTDQPYRTPNLHRRFLH